MDGIGKGSQSEISRTGGRLGLDFQGGAGFARQTVVARSGAWGVSAPGSSVCELQGWESQQTETGRWAGAGS